MRSATNSHLTPASNSFKDMAYTKLNTLRTDKNKVTLNWRKDAQSEYFVLFESYPKGLAQAASTYCAASIQEHPDRKALMTTGGSMNSCKLIFEYLIKYCTDKAHLPKNEGPKLPAWIRVHEAAQLLGVGVIEGVAMVELNIILERPVTESDMEIVLKKQPLAARYEEMIIDNLTDAMVKGRGWRAPSSHLVSVPRRPLSRF